MLLIQDVLLFFVFADRRCKLSQDIGALYGVRAWDRHHIDHRHLLETTLEMDSIMSLGGPLKQFTSCMSGKNATTKRGDKKSQSCLLYHI